MAIRLLTTQTGMREPLATWRRKQEHRRKALEGYDGCPVAHHLARCRSSRDAAAAADVHSLTVIERMYPAIRRNKAK